jgi:hypothetical protein
MVMVKPSWSTARAIRAAPAVTSRSSRGSRAFLHLPRDGHGILTLGDTVPVFGGPDGRMSRLAELTSCDDCDTARPFAADPDEAGATR